MTHRTLPLILGLALGLATLATLVTVAAPTAVNAADATANAADPAVIVYYFHGSTRCMTCVLLEDLTVNAVRDSLSEQLATKRLGLEVINVQDEANEHFADTFALEHQAVVIAAYAQGEVTRWRNLERIWELYEEPQAFAAYIVGETRSFLEARPEDDDGR